MVRNFVRIVWTVFEKFEIFIGTLDGREKRYDCISSRKIYPAPNKNIPQTPQYLGIYINYDRKFVLSYVFSRFSKFQSSSLKMQQTYIREVVKNRYNTKRTSETRASRRTLFNPKWTGSVALAPDFAKTLHASCL